MGFNGTGCGAVLADEMGLGKTLQCITLIWTVLRQGPFGGTPVLRHVLIVTPSSLVLNWRKEFTKWLGKERINVYVVDKDHSVSGFGQCRHTPVMIISYEMLTRHQEQVKECHFQLLICDEGHRLKNGNIKVSTTLRSLECPRRILLTGTPVQNDLREFYQLSNFVQPNLLGTYSEFQRDYESPILAGRQSTATEDQQLLGHRAAQQLASITRRYVLHRSQHLLTSTLPARIETVVFCRLSQRQLMWYRRVLDSIALQQRFVPDAPGAGGWGDTQTPPLVYITLLRKLCNHPQLIQDQHMTILEDISNNNNNKELTPPLKAETTPAAGFELESGKLVVVASILQHLPRRSPGSIGREKIVLISYYTQTLDLLGSLCRRLGLQCCRLDGATAVSQRQSLVDSFNSSYSTNDVFLLSAKAGGVGLNLTAASHIVLYDIDWNPANDQQALARVWRQGQTRITRVYRLITAGTIEEKIFQRQISKQALTSTVISSGGARSAKSQFSAEDLRELFTLDEDNDCSTHSLLGCSCHRIEPSAADIDIPAQTVTAGNTGGTNPGQGGISEKSERRTCQLGEDVYDEENKAVLTIASLLQWQHISPPFHSISDEGLLSAKDWITFVLRHSSKPEL